MSFGYNDNSWVDPEDDWCCCECANWNQSPTDANWGWCLAEAEYKECNDGC